MICTEVAATLPQLGTSDVPALLALFCFGAALLDSPEETLKPGLPRLQSAP
jgi:hypothetical protein